MYFNCFKKSDKTKEDLMLVYIIMSWAAAAVWMLVIFAFSAQAAEQSSRLSAGVTEVVVKTVEKVAPKAEINVHSLNHIIRKNAHFFLYMILGLLVMNAFRRCGNTVKKSLVLSFLVCVLYAVSDEIHQLYVPGRGAQMTDVIIDSLGAVTGLLFYWLAGLVCTGRREKKAS